MKDTVCNDWWEKINFTKFPFIVGLLKGIRGRPEFRGILANPRGWSQFITKIASEPASVRASLFLPINND